MTKYRNIETQALLDMVQQGGLTDLARAIAVGELNSRGVDLGTNSLSDDLPPEEAAAISEQPSEPETSLLMKLFKGLLVVGVWIGLACTLYAINFLFIQERSSGMSPIGSMIPGAMLAGMYVVAPTFVAASFLRPVASTGFQKFTAKWGQLSPLILAGGFLLGALVQGGVK
jgi:hypothetical protein